MATQTAEVSGPPGDGTVTGPSTGFRPRPRRSWKCVGRLFALVVAFPFVFLVAFALYPLVQQAIGSFFHWYDFRLSTFAGLSDYIQALHDPVVPSAALHSLVYVGCTVPVELAIGLAAAWATLRLRRFQAVFAAIVVLPLVVPWPAAAELFLDLFANQGVVNEVMGRVAGGSGVTWLQDTHGAFAVIVLLGIWKGAPWCYLLLVGALMASPPDIFEAARVDGASGARFWRYIVIPSVRPMLVFVCIFRVLAEAQMLTSVDLLTQGGPVNSTQLVSTYSQTMAFQYFEFGAACALGTLLGAALLLIAGAGWAASKPGAFSALRRHNRPPQRRLGPPPTGPSDLAPAVGRVEAGAQARRGGRRLATSSTSSTSRVPPWLLGWRRGALVLVLALLALLPLVGALPSGAEVPDTSLNWRAVETPLWNSVLITLVTAGRHPGAGRAGGVLPGSRPVAVAGLAVRPRPVLTGHPGRGLVAAPVPGGRLARAHQYPRWPGPPLHRGQPPLGRVVPATGVCQRPRAAGGVDAGRGRVLLRRGVAAISTPFHQHVRSGHRLRSRAGVGRGPYGGNPVEQPVTLPAVHFPGPQFRRDRGHHDRMAVGPAPAGPFSGVAAELPKRRPLQLPAMSRPPPPGPLNRARRGASALVLDVNCGAMAGRGNRC